MTPFESGSRCTDPGTDCGCAGSHAGRPAPQGNIRARHADLGSTVQAAGGGEVEWNQGTVYADALPAPDLALSLGTRYADVEERRSLGVERQRLMSDSRRRRHERKAAASRRPAHSEISPVRAADTPALDTVITLPRGRGSTFREFFRLMEAEGIAPRLRSEEEAEALATILLRALPFEQRPAKAERAGEKGPMGSIEPGRMEIETGETSVRPDTVFGVAEGMFPRDVGAHDEQLGQTFVFGDYAQMIADIADMGAGRIRRLKYGDIQWGSLFPVEPDPGDSYQGGETVFPPTEILRRIQADDYRVLEHVGLVLLAATLAGVRLTLTPFHAGGGSSFFGVVSERGVLIIPGEDPPNTSWGQIAAGRAEHHDGIAAPSINGWHSFYWELDEYRGRVGADQWLFQQYCINVWPVLRPWTGDTLTARYTRECARRKGLGITAFCTGVAEYLERFDAVLTEWTEGETQLRDVVEFIELGNELDGLFTMPWRAEEEIEGKTLAQGLEHEALARDGAAEAGRYMALIAGPFRRLLPWVQFRASELASTAPKVIDRDECLWYDVLYGKIVWLRDAVERGIASEVQDWDEIQRVLRFFTSVESYMSPDQLDWHGSCVAANWYWPPLAFGETAYLSMRAQDLVHEVGFHWFHGFNFGNRNTSEKYLYFDAAKLSADIDLFRRFLLEPLEDGGFRLGLSIGSITFSAVWPSSIEGVLVQSPYYEETSEKLQAAMLVRLLSVARAKVVDHLYWFNHMLAPMNPPGTAPWGSPVAGTGFHNDVVQSAMSYSDFQAEGAYPRPVWFAFRRLVWLLEHAAERGVSMPMNESGRTAVRIQLRPQVSVGPDGEAYPHAYKYAWIMWVDQYSDDPCVHGGDDPPGSDGVGLSLRDSGGVGYSVLSLVPEVSLAPPGVDANGYRAVEAPNWHWSSWPGALIAHFEETDGSGHRIRLGIRQANSTSAIAPVCILTDASRIEVIS